MVKNINEKDFKVFYNLLPTTLPTRMHFEYNCVTKLRVNCGISTKFHLYLILTIIYIMCMAPITRSCLNCYYSLRQRNTRMPSALISL